jgi:hypothetical protein
MLDIISSVLRVASRRERGASGGGAQQGDHDLHLALHERRKREELHQQALQNQRFLKQRKIW